MTLRRAFFLASLMVWATLAATRPALGADAPAETALTIDKNRFSPEEITVKAGRPFVLVITNKDGAAEEFESQELRIEKIIPAGKTVRLRMPPLKPGSYSFLGEYHEQTAKGRIIAE